MSGESKEETKLDSNRDDSFENVGSPTTEKADVASEGHMTEDPLERERQMLEWKEELLKVEGEIATLRQVLGTKVRYATELKRKMGITPFQEFKADMVSGIEHIRGSESYQKTNEKIHQINSRITNSDAYQKTTGIVRQASEKTSSAFSAVGATMSRKLGDIKNSQTFKSLEEKVEHTYSNVKAKVTGSKSSEGLSQELKEESEETSIVNPNSSVPLPEEKVPLN